MGDAPAVATGVFSYAAAEFTVVYARAATGFSSPSWEGYPSRGIGNTSGEIAWLLDKGLPEDSDLDADPNGDGVNLLMAYALNLDPDENLSDRMPTPQVTADQMSLEFHGAAVGITYAVEASEDLQTWSSAGVALSGVDGSGMRKAVVDRSGPNCFLRLVVGD